MKTSNIQQLIGLNNKLVLASASARRKKLLENLGFKFKIIPPDINENNYSPDLKPSEIAKYLSMQKAKEVAKMLGDNHIVISADTIVVLNNEILNKPSNYDDAIRILKKLSNNTHTVYTGVTLINTSNSKIISESKATEVSFRKLDLDEIKYYVNSGSPMDKAGAYGIQDDYGAIFVKEIKGCYYNIVGLPLEMFYQMLKKINVV